MRFTVDGDGDLYDQGVSLCFFCVASEWLRCDSIVITEDSTVYVQYKAYRQ